MKNLYDVETGVKKDVVGIQFKEDLNERVDCPGAFSIRGSQEDCGEVLDWARLYSGLILNYHRSHHQCLVFQFGLYMSQTSLMLTPTMESWQDRELDAKTSYLMDNVKYTSRGTFCLFDWFPPLLHFFLRSWGLLAYFPASFGHLLHYKNSAHCKANSNLITCLCWLGMMLDETNWWRMTIPKYILYRWENWFWGKEGRCSQFKPMGWLSNHLILGNWPNY